MAREPDSNIGVVCPVHAPKPNPAYFTLPLESFIGEHVKLGFDTGLIDGPDKEHMWVKVTGLYDGDEGPEELVGVLNNDPKYVMDYKDGDAVIFSRTEIEDVYNGR